jgi:hypothetical protein
MTSLSDAALGASASALGRTRLLSTSLGGWIARPWFDRLALMALGRFYLPVSRAWAAAVEADGASDRFLAALELDPATRAPAKALARVKLLADAYAAADRRWNSVLFDAPEPIAAPGVSAAWSLASDRLMAARQLFLPFCLRHAVAPTRFDVAPQESVIERYGHLIADPESAYVLADRPPAVTVSPAIERPWGREYWLRFASPGPDRGVAYAHVFEPAESDRPPSLVYANGLGVEVEAYDNVMDELFPLVARGVRLVRLELPHHTRRRRPGFYGGEPFLAQQPVGGLEFFQAAVRDMAVLVHWCRTRGSHRVGIGGTSLGALTAQLAARHARNWPEACRPNALFLVTTSAQVATLGFESELARSVGVTRALEEAGWTMERMSELSGVADPGLVAPLRPHDIVMVLGHADRVTPIRRGLQLAEHWRLPAENLFLYHRGHFSVPLGLLHDQRPLDRIARRLAS